MPVGSAAITPESFGTFGELLRYLRERAELSQRELALQVGYHYSYMSRIEKNERIPDAAVLKAQFIPALGLENEPEWTARLVELAAAREKTVSSPSDLPPVTPLSSETETEPSTVTTLPIPLTPLLGRESEVDSLKNLLLRPDIRLVTIVGPPGVGKTRLALQIAGQLLDQFSDGVLFVDLSPLTEAEQVLPTIAGALGLDDLAPASQATALQLSLRRKNILLVLDNFEQVISAAVQVTTMLGGAPNVKVLTTSREALHVAGEYEFPLTPLSFPQFSEETETATQKQRLQDLEDYPAIKLFVERAQAVKPDFKLRMHNAADVIEICSRLDGLPLAIELAAARIKILTPSAMLQQFDRRFQWLTSGTRGTREQGSRQTLQGALEWSYNLLSDAEKLLFQRLSVFVGGWTQEAAESICSTPDLPQTTIFELLAQLADKSLLLAEPGESETRYRFLETIHEFAREKLAASGEMPAVQNQHLAYFADWAEQAERELKGSAQILWANYCETEHNNIRAALDRSLKEGANLHDGLRLAAAISLFWVLRSHFMEGLKWLMVFLPKAETSPDLHLRAKLIYRAGGLALLRGNLDLAVELCHESITLCRELDDKPLLASALCYLGDALQRRGDLSSARSALEESVAVSRAIDFSSQLTVSLTNLGAVLHTQGEHEQGRAFLAESLAIATRISDYWGTEYALRTLASAYRKEHRFAEARDYFKQALEKARLFGSKSGAGITFANLAIVTNLHEDYAESGQYAKQALRIFRAIGDEEQQPFPLRMMAYAALQEGDLERARTSCIESLKGNQELGDITGMIACLVAMADIELAADHPEVTAKLLAFVESQLQTNSLTLLEPDAKSFEYLQSVIQKQSKKRAIMEAQAAGRRMTLEEALADYL